MKWRTELDFKEQKNKFNYDTNFLFMGSCFSDVIGNKLIKQKFQSTVNPFSTIFNPISLFEKISLRSYNIEAKHYLFYNELHYHYDYHSSFWSTTQNDLIQKIKNAKSVFKDAIDNCDTLILTLGTSFVHELKSSGKIISNCHKQPKKYFNKRLLGVDEIVNSFQNLLNSFDNPPKIILTVSPVRHTKEGISENSLSKSILRLACHEICQLSETVSYLPSYEIMMDDLRDYRFYKPDLIHPNKQAVDYIFNKFIQTYFSKESIQLMSKIEKINTELNHKTLTNLENKAHQKFLTQLITKIEQLPSFINFKEELNILKQDLI